MNISSYDAFIVVVDLSFFRSVCLDKLSRTLLQLALANADVRALCLTPQWNLTQRPLRGRYAITTASYKQDVSRELPGKCDHCIVNDSG